MKEIPVGDAPLEIVSSVGRRWLYVGNRNLSYVRIWIAGMVLHYVMCTVGHNDGLK